MFPAVLLPKILHQLLVGLKGASTTVLGSKVYLFVRFYQKSFSAFLSFDPKGGRSVNERRIVSDLYVFDMETFVWEQISNEPEEYVPPPRYFHSADACMIHPFYNHEPLNA